MTLITRWQTIFMILLGLTVTNVSAQTNKVSAFDVLRIQASGTFPDWPIDGLYIVESTGHVSLGAPYGRVQLRNCPLEAVESLIELHLRRYLQDPSVQASVEGPVKKWTAPIASQHPFRIQPGYILAVQLMGGLPDQPREWKAKVDENGRIALGPIYGRVAVSGLTLDEAEVAVTNHLSNVLHSPEVSVTHGGWLLEDDNDQLVSRLERLEGEVQQLKAAMSELQSGSSSAENDNPEN